jgi:hypothetical protein
MNIKRTGSMYLKNCRFPRQCWSIENCESIPLNTFVQLLRLLNQRLMSRKVECLELLGNTIFELFVNIVDLFLSTFVVGRVLPPNVVVDPRGDDQVGLAE